MLVKDLFDDVPEFSGQGRGKSTKSGHRDHGAVLSQQFRNPTRCNGTERSPQVLQQTPKRTASLRANSGYLITRESKSHGSQQVG